MRPTKYDKEAGKYKPGDEGWFNIGGAQAYVGSDGEIEHACPGLEGENITDIINESDASRDRREAKQEAAEKAGWEPERTEDARKTFEDAKEEAPDGHFVIFKKGSRYYVFGEEARILNELTNTGDGDKAEFREDAREYQLERLASEGYDVAIFEEQDGDEEEAELTDIEPALPEEQKPNEEREEDASATRSDRELEALPADGDNDGDNDPNAGNVPDMPSVGQGDAIPGENQPGDSENEGASDPQPPGPLRGMFEKLANTRDARKTGSVSTDQLNDSYAKRVYEHMQDIERNGDGFGDVYDLSDETGHDGALGYHSPAGVLVMLPPHFKNDSWEVRFATEQSRGDVEKPAEEPVAAAQDVPPGQGDGPGAFKQIGPDPSTIDPSEFIKASDWVRQERETYFQDGNLVARSRETPVSGLQIPEVGTWKVDDDFKGNHGRYIEQLQEVDPGSLILPEGDYAEDEKLNPEGRGDDAKQYAEWLKEGKEPPPINVVETEDGGLRVTDGHRRAAAAKMAGQKVKAWISPSVPVPGIKTPDGKPIYTGLTDELAGFTWNEEASQDSDLEPRQESPVTEEAPSQEEAPDGKDSYDSMSREELLAENTRRIPGMEKLYAMESDEELREGLRKDDLRREEDQRNIDDQDAGMSKESNLKKFRKKHMEKFDRQARVFRMEDGPREAIQAKMDQYVSGKHPDGKRMKQWEADNLRREIFNDIIDAKGWKNNARMKIQPPPEQPKPEKAPKEVAPEGKKEEKNQRKGWKPERRGKVPTKYNPKTKLGAKIIDAMGDDKQAQEALFDTMKRNYDLEKDYVDQYNGELSQLINQFTASGAGETEVNRGGKKTTRKDNRAAQRLLGQLSQARDAEDVKDFDLIHDMAMSTDDRGQMIYPTLMSGFHQGEGSAEKADTEQHLLEAMADGFKKYPAFGGEENFNQALSELAEEEARYASRKEAPDQEEDDWDHGFDDGPVGEGEIPDWMAENYSRRGAKSRYFRDSYQKWLRAKYSRWVKWHK